jgi:pimeloyl-ACP methyl ester carboxylesterase
MVIALWIVSLAVALIAIGVVYQTLGGRRDRRRYADGRWVCIGRRCNLYLFERGAGDPVVLFESGIGATHLNWRHVQDSIAQSAGTVSYDRAGLGWSSPCRTPRTPLNIAAEFREALRRAGISPPYVLVGHSFGGLVMRRFALLYPDDVVGVVLIDPMRCEEWPPLDPSKQSQIDLGKKLIRCVLPVAGCGLARLLVSLLFCRAAKLSNHIAGVAGAHPHHVFERLKTEVRKMPKTVWPAVAAHWSRPGFFAGLRSHIQAIPDTVREMHAADPILAIPVTVLTPGNVSPLSLDDLERIGSDTQQVIATGSEHWIHLDEPDLVIDSIRAMVAASLSRTAAAAD